MDAWINGCTCMRNAVPAIKLLKQLKAVLASPLASADEPTSMSS